ncbi:unnamed protein product, partial [Protopolystoma xenopodis]
PRLSEPCSDREQPRCTGFVTCRSSQYSITPDLGGASLSGPTISELTQTCSFATRLTSACLTLSTPTSVSLLPTTTSLRTNGGDSSCAITSPGVNAFSGALVALTQPTQAGLLASDQHHLPVIESVNHDQVLSGSGPISPDSHHFPVTLSSDRIIMAGIDDSILCNARTADCTLASLADVDLDQNYPPARMVHDNEVAEGLALSTALERAEAEVSFE